MDRIPKALSEKVCTDLKKKEDAKAKQAQKKGTECVYMHTRSPNSCVKMHVDAVALLKSDQSSPNVATCNPESSVMSPLVHVDGELTLLSVHALGFACISVLQTATNSNRAWPSLTGTMVIDLKEL